MTEISIEQLRSRLAEFDARRKHYEWKSDHAHGKLARHEVWRHNYLSYPYLIGAPDDRIATRFRSIFLNTAELGNEGKIGIVPVQDAGDSFMQKFTHMQEEYGSRGGLPLDVMQTARDPILRYFEHGDPIAVKMFANYTAPSSSFVVKYGRKQFLEPMMRMGDIRICPASYYNNDTLLDAVKDDELSRTFYIPTFQERLAGQHSIDFKGHRISFGNDDIVMPIIVPDYFLFSLCDHIYYRLPTDFDADAALIIRDPARFNQQVMAAFLAKWPSWGPMYGPVTYYDPYQDYQKVKVPEMTKHFAYSYQREVRIGFRAKQRISTTLQPEYLNIGSMTDFADLVCV
jgi:hypothetical protein